MIINKDNNKIIKNYDNRKILAYFYYYCPDNINTYGKMINSCVEAGYNKDYAKNERRSILDLDRFTDVMAIEWSNLSSNLTIMNNILSKWLNKLNKGIISTKDMRELTKLIRLIGDLQGKFIKREMKVTAIKEEKHIYHHFDTKVDEIKYYNELRSIANRQLKELNK